MKFLADLLLRAFGMRQAPTPGPVTPPAPQREAPATATRQLTRPELEKLFTHPDGGQSPSRYFDGNPPGRF